MADNKKKTNTKNSNNKKKTTTNNKKKNINKPQKKSVPKQQVDNKKIIKKDTDIINEIEVPEIVKKEVEPLVVDEKKDTKQKANTREVNINIFLIISIVLAIALMVVNNKNSDKINNYKKDISILKKEKNKIESQLTIEYLFLGDSITDKYKMQKYLMDYPVINSGISGNETQDILDDIDKRVLKYKPNKLILLIGINDLIHNKTPKDVITNIEKITDIVHKEYPNCKIYIESIYPASHVWKEKSKSNSPSLKDLTDEIKETNNKIEELCKKNDYTYVDLFDSLIDENDELISDYSDDGLHPNSNGYKKITEILIKKVFKED